MSSNQDDNEEYDDDTLSDVDSASDDDEDDTGNQRYVGSEIGAKFSKATRKDSQSNKPKRKRSQDEERRVNHAKRRKRDANHNKDSGNTTHRNKLFQPHSKLKLLYEETRRELIVIVTTGGRGCETMFPTIADPEWVEQITKEVYAENYNRLTASGAMQPIAGGDKASSDMIQGLRESIRKERAHVNSHIRTVLEQSAPIQLLHEKARIKYAEDQLVNQKFECLGGNPTARYLSKLIYQCIAEALNRRVRFGKTPHLRPYVRRVNAFMICSTATVISTIYKGWSSKIPKFSKCGIPIWPHLEYATMEAAFEERLRTWREAKPDAQALRLEKAQQLFEKYMAKKVEGPEPLDSDFVGKRDDIEALAQIDVLADTDDDADDIRRGEPSTTSGPQDRTRPNSNSTPIDGNGNTDLPLFEDDGGLPTPLSSFQATNATVTEDNDTPDQEADGSGVRFNDWSNVTTQTSFEEVHARIAEVLAPEEGPWLWWADIRTKNKKTVEKVFDEDTWEKVFKDRILKDKKAKGSKNSVEVYRHRMANDPD